jgi:hypothetical protein
MCLLLKNGCETSRCLISDRWSNDRSDSVIFAIIAAVSFIGDDHVVQDDVSIHDAPHTIPPTEVGWGTRNHRRSSRTAT